MSALTNAYIASTYPGLLHANAMELPIDGVPTIYDGVGDASALSLGRACNGASISGPLTVDNLEFTATPYVSILDMMWPIGSIYFTAYDIYPFDGWGTWVKIAQGRHIVGVGTGLDTNGNAHHFDAGNDPIGTYTVVLSTAQLPAHTHSTGGVQMIQSANANMQALSTTNKHQWYTAGGVAFQVNWDNSYPSSWGNGVGGWRQFKSRYEWSNISNGLGSSGDDQPHNNMPPTYGAYCWQRLE